MSSSPDLQALHARPLGQGWRWLARNGRWPGSRNLRVQVTAGLLVVLLPSFMLSYVGLNLLAQQEISRLMRSRLVAEAGLLAYGLQEWGTANRRMLKSLSFDKALQTRDQAGSTALLRSLQGLYPYRDWRYWTADPQPKLLAYSDELSGAKRARMEATVLRRPYFQEALAGRPSYGMSNSVANDKTCLMIAQPVYRDGHANTAQRIITGENALLDERPSANSNAPTPLPSPQAQRPTGVLSSCILLEHLGLDTGLQRALARSNLVNRSSGKDNADEFSRDRPVDKGFILISHHGHVLYPTDRGDNKLMPSVSQYSKGYWAPIFRLARNVVNGKKEAFMRVQVGSDRYFVLINYADSAWSTMLILNQKQAFAGLNRFLERLALLGVLCLMLAVAAMIWQCGRITAPIRAAGRALQRISDGDFETRIAHERSDEIGQLLDNINSASAQLKLYVRNEMAHAVTQRQMQTARDIQKDFLVARMPSCNRLELAPTSLPAYEVGADWYDALRIKETTYIVVADVCDKGIPSALYMSVFRSLLRYGLLAHEQDCTDTAELLQTVVTQVNAYMANNHGGSMMFATIFLAAIQSSSGVLDYICAGHELPVLATASGLQSLETTGPAVGLFPCSSYGVRQLQLQPGDMLLAYSDGLTDARSPADLAWGRKRLLDFMGSHASHAATAQQLLAELLNTVQGHMAGTPPFDDLTVMVLRRTA